MSNDFADDGITANTAAQLLRVPLSYVLRLIDERALPSRLIGSRIYVRPTDVLAFAADDRVTRASAFTH
jgi:excisionase family DNA binding protein